MSESSIKELLIKSKTQRIFLSTPLQYTSILRGIPNHDVFLKHNNAFLFL